MDLFDISEVSRNAAICSAIEREGIVLYDKERPDSSAKISSYIGDITLHVSGLIFAGV